MKIIYLTLLFSVVLFAGCSVSKSYKPDGKYSPETLKEDYSLLRKILEDKHPALYWYTPKDSMDFYFNKGYQNISDSMTELQFGWKIVAPVLNKIHCGHTSFNMSRNWYHFIKDKRIPSFPLYLKTWKDSMVVTGNLNKQDSIFKRGTIIKSINGIPNKELIKIMSSYLPQDGFENNINNLRFSTGFPYYHQNIFGIYKNYSVEYLDSSGLKKKAIIPYFNPANDTLKVKNEKKEIKLLYKKLNRKERLLRMRELTIDSSKTIANINLYTFSKAHLRHFFRRSFREIKQKNIKNLVIDIRGNGGGDIGNYVALTRFIKNTNFKVSDSSYARAKSLAPYSKYIKGSFFTNLGLRFLTKNKSDFQHFEYWEKHIFHPKKNNHFDHDVYVVTNGFTFSASSLFCNAVKGQNNVTIVGENTGGGWYGNSGIFIPEIILPQTKLRVRLPLFKIVQYNHVASKGTGVPPDVEINPTTQSVIDQSDLKLIKIKELIRSRSLRTKVE